MTSSPTNKLRCGNYGTRDRPFKTLQVLIARDAMGHEVIGYGKASKGGGFGIVTTLRIAETGAARSFLSTETAKPTAVGFGVM